MKKILYISIFLLVPCLLSAAGKSEAIFNVLSKTYTLNEDGSQSLRVRKEIKVLSHVAFRSMYGETFVTYNPLSQDVKINESYTRQSDGTIIKTPENAFVEVLPSAAAGAPAYNHLKELVIIHTGLEIGATIYLDYTLNTKAGYYDALDIYATVQELSPITKYTLQINVPADKPLHYELINGNVKPTVKTANGMKQVTWSMSNLPCVTRRDVTPAAGKLQVIVANTYSDKQAAIQTLFKHSPLDADKTVKEKAEALTKGLTGEAKEEAIDNYVKGLGNCALNLDMTGFRLRTPAEIIQSAYGSNDEKLILKAALRKACQLPVNLAVRTIQTTDENASGLSNSILVDTKDPVQVNLTSFYAFNDPEGNKLELKADASPLEISETLRLSEVKATEEHDSFAFYSIAQPTKGIKAALSRLLPMGTKPLNNILLPYLPNETYTTKIIVKDGQEIVATPANKKVSNKYGIVSIETTKNTEGVTVVRHLALTQQVVKAEEYALFYELVKVWNDPTSTTVITRTK